MRKKTGTIILLTLFLAALNRPLAGSPHADFKKWQKFAASSDAARIISWAKGVVMKELGPGSSSEKDRTGSKFPDNPPPFYGRLGIFVTLVKGGRVRGCYGAFHHGSDDLKSVLTSYIRGALRYDPRSRPLGIEEAGEADIIITIASQPRSVNDLYSVDISRYGIMFSLENGASLVFVPSEIKTHDYLKRRLGERRTSGISAFRAVTIKAMRGDAR
jgi:AMMECR1 domain-containing protein